MIPEGWKIEASYLRTSELIEHAGSFLRFHAKEWANGAKILASRISAADLIRSRIDLHPFHVILLQQDVEELKDSSSPIF